MRFDQPPTRKLDISESVLTTLESSRIVNERYLPLSQEGISGDIKILKLESGEIGFFKTHGDAPTKEMGIDFINREIATYKVDELLDFGVIVPTTKREISSGLLGRDKQSGSMQLFLENAKTLKELTDSEINDINEESLVKLFVIDFITNMGDRSSNNVIVKDNKIYGIDNSHAFDWKKQEGAGDYESRSLRRKMRFLLPSFLRGGEFAYSKPDKNSLGNSYGVVNGNSVKIPDDIKDTLRNLINNESKLQEFQQCLSPFLKPEEVSATINRIILLIENIDGEGNFHDFIIENNSVSFKRKNS